MDITLICEKTDKFNNKADQKFKHLKRKAGSVIEVFHTETMAQLVGDSWVVPDIAPEFPFVFVHIKNVPETLNFEQLRDNLRNSIMDDVIEPEMFDILPIRSRKFIVDIDNLPNDKKQEIDQNKQTTILWDINKFKKIKIDINDKKKDTKDTKIDVVEGELDG